MIAFLPLQVEHRANNFRLLVLVLAPPRPPRGIYGLHLLVPGVGTVGGTSQVHIPTSKKSLSRGPNKSPDTPFYPVSTLPKAPRRHTAYTFLSLVQIKF